jgi:hypothetical protein
VQAVAGENAHPFSGRIGSSKLSPGVYRATLTATDAAGLRSTGSKQLSFTVVSL